MAMSDEVENVFDETSCFMADNSGNVVTEGASTPVNEVSNV